MADQSFHLVKVADGVRYEIDTDRTRLDMRVIHGFLAASHWARGIPMATLQRAIRRSMPFGLYKNGQQIGFARVVTDGATFAYLADVFVLETERGQGLARWLVESILAHPGLQGLRRWLLGTRDAHGLYRKAGFTEPPAPFGFLERLDGAVYETAVVPRRRALRRVV
ncbi:MAG TPA: GNAT family N-acetyltransferase [Stellaceae bacterium]|nr:GNAT family N-acetyltransferase [Stellaceae bacterium]